MNSNEIVGIPYTSESNNSRFGVFENHVYFHIAHEFGTTPVRMETSHHGRLIRLLDRSKMVIAEVTQSYSFSRDMPIFNVEFVILKLRNGKTVCTNGFKFEQMNTRSE